MAIATSLVTNTGSNIYIASGNTVVTWASFCNYSTGNIIANIHVLTTGQTANAQNQIGANVLITSGDTYQLYAGNEKLLFSNLTALYAISNTNTALNSVVSWTYA
jgi:hypothetical protein